jgi:hypothetical protein
MRAVETDVHVLIMDCAAQGKRKGGLVTVEASCHRGKAELTLPVLRRIRVAEKMLTVHCLCCKVKSLANIGGSERRCRCHVCNYLN